MMIDGKPQIVIVDDFIPVRMSDSNKPFCCLPNQIIREGLGKN